MPKLHQDSRRVLRPSSRYTCGEVRDASCSLRAWDVLEEGECRVLSELDQHRVVEFEALLTVDCDRVGPRVRFKARKLL